MNQEDVTKMSQELEEMTVRQTMGQQVEVEEKEVEERGNQASLT